MNFDRHVLLGLHLPKCGGASLNKVVFKNCRDLSGTRLDEDMFYEGVGWFPASGFANASDPSVESTVRRVLARADLRAYIGHFWYGIHDHLEKPWTYFTVLRHPVDRILSLYHHVGQGPLGDFLTNPPIREVDNAQTRRISGMEAELGGCTDEMLQQARQHLAEDFAVVGLTERYEETLVLLGRTFHWDLERLPNQRYNVSRNRLQSVDLEDSVRRKILDRNRLDLELYEYACNLFEEAISRQGPGFREDVARVVRENGMLPVQTYLDPTAATGLHAEAASDLPFEATAIRDRH